MTKLYSKKNMENQRKILENITQKENEANQVRLVELNDEYVIELPIQQKIQEAILELKKKRFDKRISRWVIPKEERDRLTKSLKPLTRVSLSKIANKKYTNPEIELKINEDENGFEVEIVNYREFPMIGLELIKMFKELPSRKYDFETKLWAFGLQDREDFRKGLKQVATSNNINLKYNDF